MSQYWHAEPLAPQNWDLVLEVVINIAISIGPSLTDVVGPRALNGEAEREMMHGMWETARKGSTIKSRENTKT